MVDTLDESVNQREIERKKFRIGFVLFMIYVIGYSLFTLAGTLYRELLAVRIFGVNTGVLSGMIIIASAIIIAVFYNWYSGKLEAK